MTAHRRSLIGPGRVALSCAAALLLALPPVVAPPPAGAQSAPPVVAPPSAVARTPAVPESVSPVAQGERSSGVTAPAPDATAFDGPVLTDAPGASWPEPGGVDAEAYLLVEADTGQHIVASDAHDRRPVASTVKLLTAYTVIQRATLDDEVVVGDEVTGVPGSGAGLEPGDRWTVEELLDGLLSRSGNDAAETLAMHVGGDRDTFLQLMERDAAALGVRGLTLTSPSGLDDTQRLSAQDLAIIAMAVLQQDELRQLLAREIVTLPDQPAAPTRNELLGSYPGATGMKTGFTTLAGHSFVASAQREGRDLIAVVLGAGEDPARFVHAATLLDFGYGQTRRTQVGTDVQMVVGGGRIRVQVPPAPVTIPVDHDADLRVSLPVRPPDEPLVFPVVVDGEELGALTAEPTSTVRPVDDDSALLGRALVDGTYAALRAAGAAGTL